MPQLADQPVTGRKDFLPLAGIDHVEFYVGNAKQAAHYYRTAFGMRLTAYQGPETGVRDHVSYVLEQSEIRFVFTTALNPDHPIAAHVATHGDGVKSIAITVEDAHSAYQELKRRGAVIVRELETLPSSSGPVAIFSIAIYGDTIHTFVERKNFGGRFLPGFEPTPLDTLARPTGLEQIDHMVGNVALGEMEKWVAFYRDVMGFDLYQSFDDTDISTEYSALMSKVMSTGDRRIRFPINEPAQGRKKSQIEEYLDFYRGAGVQHIAMLTSDIIGTVTRLRGQGVEFLDVPQAYYEDLPGRVGEIEESLKALAELGVLVDRDDEGYLLQIFTKPVQDRPTLFYEIIERKGARGFGKGNFKALFEAIEREQARRGNL